MKEYLTKNAGLGAVSEQAAEWAHARFKNIRQKSIKVKNVVIHVVSHYWMQYVRNEFSQLYT